LPVPAAGSVVITTAGGLGPLQIGHERRQKISDYSFGEQQQVSWEIQYSYCATERQKKPLQYVSVLILTC